ncbi:MAG TPA: PBP1A family penicillin-binding protein [Gemmatimonadaceae bacterium]|jgi:penicillin-binding protein 1A|nr:PBP1A family penicillin-binding protein [Gemmatimonadaceae bacterium]
MDLPFSKKFRRDHPQLTRGLGIGLAFGLAFVVGFAYAAWALVCRAGACPAVEVLEQYQPRQTSKLYAVDGRFIAELGLERRTLLKIDQIPPLVRNAFVMTEDKRFYNHAGVDFHRIPGAVLVDIRSRSFAEGFSTITMQLARNIFPERLSRDKSPVRKLKEIKVAREIEKRYSKDKILELYLNQIALGNGSFGIETAAQRYFGKSARELNLAEAATLAGLPKAPERYNPRRFPERAIQRRNTVIEVMREQGGVSDADASLAKAYPLQLARKSEAGDVAPYFVEWVRQQLEQQFGQRLYEQGLKVFTTLDVDFQSAAERAMENQLRAIEAGRFGAYKHRSYEAYMSTASERAGSAAAANSPYLQGAFVAMDPRTGAVRALVGGRDFDDSKFNRATQALRQPGSTFKPIVYADAVQNGRPPTYLVDDSPVSVPQSGGGNWTPQNYDGKFEGPMPMRRGLYQSRNIVAIKVGMELGPQSVTEEARKFGITTPIPPYPSIYIGAADVYPIEMVAAYSAFATLGTRSTPTAIVRVENSKGDVLWEPTPVRTPVMSAEEAWLMVSMMKDVVQRGTAAGSVGSQFHIPAGGKTGTTNDGADVWFIGYTSDMVAGVWMGLDKPKQIKGNAQGGILAAPAWTAFMREVYRRKPASPDWPRPEGIVIRQVDAVSGQLWAPGCGPAVTDYFLSGTDPIGTCTPSQYPPGTSPVDSSFGFPVPGSPAPPQSDSAFIARARVSPGGMVTQGAAPIPRTTRTRPSRDSSGATPASAPRDTANPFALPPSQRR